MTARHRPPLDAAQLDALALGYAARYATTRARLSAYLKRKLRERGFDGEPPVAAIVERMAALGFVDDRAFADTRSAALSRRGYGGRRIGAALAAAGVERDVAAEVAPSAEAAFDSAETYARRRRIGPFAVEAADPDARSRNLAAMLRAGHDYALASRFISAAPGAFPKRDD